MQIQKVILRQMKMTLKAPFTTSFGSMNERKFILAEVQDREGRSGWGECVAFDAPWYTEETTQTCWSIMESFLIPRIIGKEIVHPSELNDAFKPVKRNFMAKSAIEGAVWDLYAKRRGQSLKACLGGKKDKIEVGLSIGIQESIPRLLEVIEKGLSDGYKRIKVKIKPGYDVELLREIRRYYPDIPLMADANSSYRLSDIDTLRRMDEFGLTMIEQPLAADDIIDHAALQARMKTPICLDESITSAEDARKAIQIGACGVINIKIGRVGGNTEAMKIHDLCLEKNIPVWCGGMLESGIGRAHNIALTSLVNFVLPGDTAASANYWNEDIIEPEVTVEDGSITVPDTPGIGYHVCHEKVNKYTVYSKMYE